MLKYTSQTPRGGVLKSNAEVTVLTTPLSATNLFRRLAMDTLPPFDEFLYFLGKLCKRRHDFFDGKSLRLITKRECLACKRLTAKIYDKERPNRTGIKSTQNRMMVDEIKLTRGCTDCGYKTHPAALQFDHLPGSKKIDIVAKMVMRQDRKALIDEIAKCEVVCANCHAIRTAKRRLEARNV